MSDEIKRARELRSYWRIRSTVRLELADGCAVRNVEGQVEMVSVTGAFVMVDGWHIPISKIVKVSGDAQVEI